MSNHRPEKKLDKVMLGFVVRKCAREIGHTPTAEEFAAWANNQTENGHHYCLFGQPISPYAASVMLRHLGRLVKVRSPSVVKAGSKSAGGRTS